MLNKKLTQKNIKHASETRPINILLTILCYLTLSRGDPLNLLKGDTPMKKIFYPAITVLGFTFTATCYASSSDEPAVIDPERINRNLTIVFPTTKALFSQELQEVTNQSAVHIPPTVLHIPQKRSALSRFFSCFSCKSDAVVEAVKPLPLPRLQQLPVRGIGAVTAYPQSTVAALSTVARLGRLDSEITLGQIIGPVTRSDSDSSFSDYLSAVSDDSFDDERYRRPCPYECCKRS